MSPNNLRIASCANECFAQGLTLAVLSSFSSASGQYQYDYSILDGGLSTETKKKLRLKLQEISEQSGKRFTLEFLQPDLSLIDQLPERANSWLTYARFLLPNLLTDNYAIYLDSDVLCLRGLEEFYQKWDHRAPFVAVKDPLQFLKNDRPYGMPSIDSKTPYFSAGILLLNLSWMRDYMSLSDVVSFTHKYDPSKYKCADQTIINNMVNGDFIEIPYQNNHILCMEWSAKIDKWSSSNWHFIGRSKPWMKDHQSRVTKYIPEYLFYKYSQFYGVNLIKKPLWEKGSLTKIKQKAFWYKFVRYQRSLIFSQHLKNLKKYDAICKKIDLFFEEMPPQKFSKK